MTGRLTGERQSQLGRVPGWVWDTRDVAWEDAYDRLLQFAEREGHSRVPANYRDENEFKLGQWVSDKRKAQRRGRLSEERQRRLEGLPGWVWDAREATKRGS